MSRSVKAFTLVELMVGLMVTSIILSAVATLAFALSSASTAGGDYACTQAQIRHATVRLLDLVGRCHLICAAPADDLVLWRADDNADRRININEVVYIETGANHEYLRLCEFTSADNPEVTLAALALPATKAQFVASYSERYTPLIPECSSVQFAYDLDPPATTLLAVTFDLEEDRASHRYQIVATARCRAGHLLDAAGTAIVESDDD